MSEEKKKDPEPDYRKEIRKRAEQSSSLRQQAFEKVDPKRSLRQKIELANDKQEKDKE